MPSKMNGLSQFEKVTISGRTKLGQQIDSFVEKVLRDPRCAWIAEDREATLCATK